VDQYSFIAGFCVFCFLVSAGALRIFKSTWVYFFVSTTLPAMLLVGADAIWRGYLDAWADIAFVVSMFISLACALAYFIFRKTVESKKGKQIERANQ
jgi:hypothetical protein